MAEAALPVADAIEEALHPRFAPALLGQEAAVAQFFEALRAGKLHHAWLMTGPKGVGKATMAWKMAAHLITHGAELPEGMADFANDPHSPATRQLLALSHPQFFLLRRKYDEKAGRLAQNILVDDVRALRQFFQLSAADQGYRVVIIDTVDEMNIAAANALLKILEEPPQRAVILLISHQPSLILPTLRSRCRRLTLGPLSDEMVQRVIRACDAQTEAHDLVVELAGGSAGEAVRLCQSSGLELFTSIDGLLSNAPAFDRHSAHALAASLAPRTAQSSRVIFCEMLEKWVQITAKSASFAFASGKASSAFAQSEADLAHFAAKSTDILRRLREGLLVNLDAEALILDTLMQLAHLARRAK